MYQDVGAVKGLEISVACTKIELVAKLVSMR